MAREVKSMKSFYILLFNLVFAMTITAALAVSNAHKDELRRLVASQEAQNEALEAKARVCAMKAARVANEVNPRYYTPTTTQNIYETCLKEN